MDKTDRLLEAIEYPERYSETEIEALLRDTEVKEAYSLLEKTKASMQNASEPDVDKEWRAFKRNNASGHTRILPLFSRKVAAGIAIGIVSLGAVATVVGISMKYSAPQNKEQRVKQMSEDTSMVSLSPDTMATRVNTDNALTAPETIIFDNEPFVTIMNRIADHYGYQTVFKDNAPKSLRLYFKWNQALPVEDVVESLDNFEQINLAIQGRTILID